jgi:hypothetical protein
VFIKSTMARTYSAESENNSFNNIGRKGQLCICNVSLVLYGRSTVQENNHLSVPHQKRSLCRSYVSTASEALSMKKLCQYSIRRVLYEEAMPVQYQKSSL